MREMTKDGWSWKTTEVIEYDGRLLPEFRIPNCHVSLCENKARWMCDNCCSSICDFHISSASEGHVCQKCRLIKWKRGKRYDDRNG